MFRFCYRLLWGVILDPSLPGGWVYLFNNAITTHHPGKDGSKGAQSASLFEQSVHPSVSLMDGVKSRYKWEYQWAENKFLSSNKILLEIFYALQIWITIPQNTSRPTRSSIPASISSPTKGNKNFWEAWKKMQKIELENDLLINYIGLNDLLKNKQVSGCI